MNKIVFQDNQFHSTYSDGDFTPQQIFDYNQLHDRLDLTITDHVDKNTNWFADYVKEIKKLRQKYKDFTIKIGCEVKIIDESGELNTTKEILNQAEVVIGVVHHFSNIKSLTPEELIKKEFELTKLLAQNKKIDILGHPFSMVTRFFNADVPKEYVKEIYELCRKNKIKFEYNKKTAPASVKELVLEEIAQGNVDNFSFGSDMHDDLKKLGESGFDIAEIVNVLVTGAGAGVGQSIIKALKLMNIKTNIVAVDADHKTAGLYRANTAYTVPRFADQNYLPKIIEICQKEKIDIMFVGTDVELTVLAENKEKIESATAAKVIVSDPETIKIADDKWQTFEFLKANNFPRAKTWLAKDINQALEEISFPAVVKPQIGARSIGFNIVNNPEELTQKIKEIENPIIQEYLADENSEYTCGGFFYEGKSYGMITAQRWLRAGDTYKAHFYHDQELERFIEKIGSKLKITGPCNFQLRQTKNGPTIFEINCRFSGTTGAASYLGFNVVNALIQKIIFTRPLKPLDFKEAFMLRYWNETFIDPDQVRTLADQGVLKNPQAEINSF